MISLTEDKRMLEYELLSSYSNIFHFVTTRSGGSGKGSYASFNCSPYCGDSVDAVSDNQKLLLQGMNQQPDRLIIPHQTHETNIRVIDAGFLTLSADQQNSQLKGIDAVVTDLPGYCLCVSTADCVPLLMYDRKHHVIAAVHAGWRGTVARIVNKTLQGMQTLYGTEGQDLCVAIGPSISQVSFEVGEEVLEAFREEQFDMERIAVRNQKSGKPHIDLWEANRLELMALGVPDDQIQVAGVCTYIHHNHFFSARRLGINSGRMLSGIMINKE